MKKIILLIITGLCLGGSAPAEENDRNGEQENVAKQAKPSKRPVVKLRPRPQASQPNRRLLRQKTGLKSKLPVENDRNGEQENVAKQAKPSKRPVVKLRPRPQASQPNRRLLRQKTGLKSKLPVENDRNGEQENVAKQAKPSKRPVVKLRPRPQASQPNRSKTLNPATLSNTVGVGIASQPLTGQGLTITDNTSLLVPGRAVGASPIGQSLTITDNTSLITGTGFNNLNSVQGGIAVQLPPTLAPNQFETDFGSPETPFNLIGASVGSKLDRIDLLADAIKTFYIHNPTLLTNAVRSKQSLQLKGDNRNC